jgi:hypothetical protein
MNNKTLFTEINPPEGLTGAILWRIEAERRRVARFRFISMGAVAGLSATAMVPMAQYTMAEFYQSGFYQYSSLLLSDGGSILTYWREFTITLAESAPLLGITLSLALVFVLVGSLQSAFNNRQFIHSPKLIV